MIAVITAQKYAKPLAKLVLSPNLLIFKRAGKLSQLLTMLILVTVKLQGEGQIWY